ncbi:MAG: hypothetical protein WDM78_02540 [Puia sp.]
MNIRPDFDIHNEDPTAEDPNQCRLLVEIGSCSLTYVLLNVRGMRPSAIKFFKWPTLRTNEPETILRVYWNQTLYSAGSIRQRYF